MSKITLYDCAFSPFARKVRMVLEYKQLAFDAIDGLHASNQAALAAVNARREVPALIDGDIVVVNSSHIVSYLEEAYPERSVLPTQLAQRVSARNWERIADTVVDPIIVDISLWSWAERSDTPPEGLLEAARRDLDAVYVDMEGALAKQGEFVCGSFSLADIALFPNLYSARHLGVGVSQQQFPRVAAWLQRMADLPLVRDDLNRVRAWLKVAKDPGYEKDKIFWRGERIEWMLAAGFHQWFFNEIEQGRVIWPARPMAATRSTR